MAARASTVRKRRGASVESEALAEYIDPAVTLKPRKMAVVTKELQKIVDDDGVLTAEKVLEVATSDDHPLHLMFEWDDTAAAHRFRVNQARAMIIAAKIVYQRKKQKLETAGKLRLRRFVSRGARQGFSERAAVIGEAEIRQNLVRSRLRAIRSAVNELADLRELDDFRAAMAKQIEVAASAMKVNKL